MSPRTRAEPIDVGEVPVIDIAPLRNGDDPAGVGAGLARAATGAGFLYVRNHGVETALIERARRAALAFFSPSRATVRRPSRRSTRWTGTRRACATTPHRPRRATAVSRRAASWLGNNIRVSGSLTLTITDDEAPLVMTLVLTPDSIDENGGQTKVTGRLNRISSVDTEVGLDYTLRGGRQVERDRRQGGNPGG